MKLKITLLSIFIFALFSANAQETNAPAFGKGLFNLVGKDSTWTMKIATRMQFLTIAEWQEGADGGMVDPEQNMLMRRARLKFDGFAFSPKLKYKIELGLSNRDISGASVLSPETRHVTFSTRWLCGTLQEISNYGQDKPNSRGILNG